MGAAYASITEAQHLVCFEDPSFSSCVFLSMVLHPTCLSRGRKKTLSLKSQVKKNTLHAQNANSAVSKDRWYDVQN